MFYVNHIPNPKLFKVIVMVPYSDDDQHLRHCFAYIVTTTVDRASQAALKLYPGGTVHTVECKGMEQTHKVAVDKAA